MSPSPPFPLPLSLYLDQVILAQPWSTPSKSEAMLLVTVLICATMLSTALFFDKDPRRMDEMLTNACIATIISSLPAQIFLVLLRTARRFDDSSSNKTTLRRQRLLGRLLVTNRQWRLKTAECGSRTKSSYPGERVATLMYSVICAKKVAHTLAERMEQRRISRRILFVIKILLHRIMGVSPDVQRIRFRHETEDVSGENLLLPRRARLIVHLLMVILCAM